MFPLVKKVALLSKANFFFYENMPKKPYRRGEKGASPNWPSTHKCPPDRKKKVPSQKSKGGGVDFLIWTCQRI